ncbi:hypothetical protein PYCC9005_004785 [Savitreella phatthalungensis]
MSSAASLRQRRQPSSTDATDLVDPDQPDDLSRRLSRLENSHATLSFRVYTVAFAFIGGILLTSLVVWLFLHFAVVPKVRTPIRGVITSACGVIEVLSPPDSTDPNDSETLPAACLRHIISTDEHHHKGSITKLISLLGISHTPIDKLTNHLGRLVTGLDGLDRLLSKV